MALEIEVLDKSAHNIRKFRCGKTVMDVYLRQFADKNQRLGLSRTWVMVDKISSEKEKLSIVGYFTLSVQSVDAHCVDQTNQLPEYHVPVTLLARIAVDQQWQGQKIGSRLLLSALKQALNASERGLSTYAVILDVLDKEAVAFYSSFNFFQPFGDTENKLFVPMAVQRFLK